MKLNNSGLLEKIYYIRIKFDLLYINIYKYIIWRLDIYGGIVCDYCMNEFILYVLVLKDCIEF